MNLVANHGHFVPPPIDTNAFKEAGLELPEGFDQMDPEL